VDRETSNVELLDRVLDGRLAPDDAPRSVARLATLATTVSDSVEVDAPSPAFRNRLRAELLQAPGPAPTLSLTDRYQDVRTRLSRSMRATVATATAASLIGVAGVAAAAQHALPGDQLHPVKTTIERVRLSFSLDQLDRGQLHLAFATTRLSELERGVHRMSPDQVRDTLARLDEDAATGTNLLLGDLTPELQALLDEFTGDTRRRLLALEAVLPLSVRDATERTLEVLRRIDLQVQHARGIAACPACEEAVQLAGSSLVFPAPQVVLPGDGPAQDMPCTCLPGSSGSPAADGDAGGEPAVEPDGVGDTEGTGSETSGGTNGDLRTGDGLTGTDLDDAVDDLTDPVEDAVDDLTDVVDDVGDELEDTVDDLTDPLEDTVDDAGSLLDDLLRDP
jgi:hypothetical protein